jgi:hypothetical protein
VAKISFERADQMVTDILDKYSSGEKRTVMLKQVIRSMMNGMPAKQAITKANNLVLRYDLDLNDKIPLFKVALK